MTRIRRLAPLTFACVPPPHSSLLSHAPLSMTATDPVVSVAVVGGGVAGLAAARELARTLPDVVLLEAADRLGGRVKQVCVCV